MEAAQPLTLTELDTLPAVGRKKFDAYYTPQALADSVVEWLERDGFWRGGDVLEPSAGKGAFARAAMYLQPHSVTCFDIDPERCAALKEELFSVRECDFLEQPIGETYELVLGNPPFAGAEAHVRKALSMRAPFGAVAFLLRLAFLESLERIPFWKENPASKIYVLSERPSFSGLRGATDSAAYAIFCWASWHRGPTEIEVMSWKPARASNLSPVIVQP